MLKAEVSIVGNKKLSEAASRVLQRCFEMERDPMKTSGNMETCINLWLTKVKEPSWKGEDQAFSKEDQAKRTMLLEKLLKKHNEILESHGILPLFASNPDTLKELLDVISEYLNGIATL